MFKSLFTLLITVLWCTVLMAQVNDADPNGVPGTVVDTPGDILYTWDLDPLTAENGNLGCEYAFGYLWVTSRGLNSPLGNKVTKIDVSDPLNPVVVDSFSQGTTSSWGWRDLASDGTYLYASDDANVTQIDPATGTVVGSFPGPASPNRALAYDPATDHFWTISFGGSLYEFDRTGTVINTFPNPASTYGAGWDPWSPGGPFLWLNGGSSTTVLQVDPLTGIPTGVSYSVSPTGIVGGLDVDVDLVPGKIVGVALSQETPDKIFVVELGDYTSGGGCFTDDFDLYTAGVQLVGQSGGEWDTWSGGGGTGEDPYVSNAYSWSDSNTVVVAPGNDFVREHGDQTTGKWWMSLIFYIPDTKSGYFNTMNEFIRPGTFTWGMDAFFDVGGAGRLDTAGAGGGGGGATVVNFTWTVAQWNQAIVIVDLDASPPLAEFWIGNTAPLTQVATWDWTQAGTKINQLAVNDFYGGQASDEMYMDDYYFCDTPPVIIPVELTSFTANVNHNGQVELYWSTATETNNQLFEIERRTEEGQFATIGYVEGHGTTTEPQHYSYTDVTVTTGIYFYRLKQLDFLGYYEYFDEIEVDVTGPLSFDLSQNYPNPFNPSTNIKYSVPESGDVRLAVYNLIGEEVAVLVDGFSEAGFFEVTFNASLLPSGVYFYKLQSGNSVVAKKMLLMK